MNMTSSPTPTTPTPDLGAFLAWFQTHGGTIDLSSLDMKVFPASEGGRGVVAVRDIPENHTLFTIPRALVLSTLTSPLPGRFGAGAWKERGLGRGWGGLILCMMWEEACAGAGMWGVYLETLPSAFDTPMFWSEEDVRELEGTSVCDKIGREDAERNYREVVLPAIQSREDLFAPALIPVHYSLERYHVMGSRILSRSFVVERWEGEEGEEGNKSRDSGMDVDEQPDVGGSRLGEEGEGGQEDEDEEEEGDVSMVPMADLLNARYGSENAKLFYEENELRMVSTRPIKAGEQIWNTYGDLPNAELLRRYGHVDLLPLEQGGQGNPGDVVEIRADLVVGVISQQQRESGSEGAGDVCQERIDWWLEEGGDDVFVLEADCELPEALVSLIRLLSMDGSEWEKVRNKGKPPKARVDAGVLGVAMEVLNVRLGAYPTSLEMDKDLLFGEEGAKSGPWMSLNRKHAVIVRVGEKKILGGVVGKVKTLLDEGRLKRKEEDGDLDGSRKKRRR